MTGLVVQQSSILGVAATTAPIAAAAASSLALSIFRDTKKTNIRILPRRTTSPAINKKTKENPVIQLYRSWMRLPQILRFCVAGNLANLGFFFLEKVIFQFLSYLIVSTSVLSSNMLDGIEKYQDGISFFSAYIIQIVTGHLLYAFLVYGTDTINTYEKYSKTLSGQFKVYGVGLFGATFLNSFLINSTGLDKTAAFWTTTATFAVFNYFLVSWVVARAIKSSSPKVEKGTRPSRRR